MDSIRLITSPEEAKALNEAGFPQVFDPEYDRWYQDSDSGNILRAPRLDELLAWLYENCESKGGLNVSFHSCHKDRSVEAYVEDSETGELLFRTDNDAQGDDRSDVFIRTLVEAAIYVLTNNPTS